MKEFQLEVTGPRTAYLRLPAHPGELRGAHTVTLPDVMGAYKGPYVVFDFDAQETLVGIEVIDEEDDDDEGNAEIQKSFKLDLMVQATAYLRLPTHSSDVGRRRSASLRDFVKTYAVERGPDAGAPSADAGADVAE